MNFGNKKYIILLFFFIIVLSFFLKKNKPIYSVKLIKELELNTSRFIAHSGGGIEGYKYTNSEQAIKKSIKQGYKFIEIDLLETKDHVFVGVHDWKSFKEKTNFKNNSLKKHDPISYNEFKKLKIYSKFNPIDIYKINNIFSTNTELFLLTDKTSNYQKIKRDFKFNQNRLLVEIFGKDNFYKAIKNKINNPIYNYNLGDYKFVNKNKIRIISSNINNILNNQEEFKKMIKNGIFIFAYSSNNEKLITNNIGKLFTHVYTDFWDIKKLQCTVKSDLCTTY